jgi:hypothetical protein
MNTLTHVLGLACVALAAACSGGETCSNINGSWASEAQVDATACGLGTTTESLTYVFTQATGSCGFSLAAHGNTFDGTVDGTAVSWTGSYPLGSGTTTLTKVDLTVDATGTSMSGTMEWSFVSSSRNCTGTTTFSAKKSG